MKRFMERLNRLAADRGLLADRSGAIALIFALTIVPLILLVALSIDYAFYVQSRAQASLAADSAATHAVRAADAIYTYELSNGTAAATAVSDAEADGSAIGKNWFFAALDTMPKATITGAPNIILTQNANGSAGFTATVSFAGTYPPFFDSLFNNRLWNINGNAQAQSAFKYVEILMLLDNSSSMLIASGTTAITQLEELTVCPSSGIEGNFGGNAWTTNPNNNAYFQHVSPDAAGLAPMDVPEAAGAIANYTPATSETNIGTGESGTGYGYAPNICAAGWTGKNATNSDGTSAPYAPCAFACHTTTDPLQVPQTNAQGTVTGDTANSAYTNDYYGIARRAGIQLRLDVVQSAASQVITAMQTNEQAANQFSVGIYEFNDDVIPVWPSPSNGQQASEASTDLADAATAIQNTAPPIQANASIGNTNFPAAVDDMISGTYLNGAQYRADAATTSSPALTASGTGTTAATPQKDVFIVTDGMEDTSASGSRVAGEMTGYEAETGTPLSATPALCGQLKTLGYTVYVLYINYNPLGNTWYQSTGTLPPTPYGAQDDPALYKPTKYYAESTTYSEGNPPGGNTSLAQDTPDEWGLIGCATNPSDFFEATSDSEIGATMNAMLHAALTSTIQLTQ